MFAGNRKNVLEQLIDETKVLRLKLKRKIDDQEEENEETRIALENLQKSFVKFRKMNLKLNEENESLRKQLVAAREKKLDREFGNRMSAKEMKSCVQNVERDLALPEEEFISNSCFCCDEQVANLENYYDVMVCSSCIERHLDTLFLSEKEAMEIFNLNAEDLEKVVLNQHKPEKLFDRGSIENVAIKKFGSLRGMLKAQRKNKF